MCSCDCGETNYTTLELGDKTYEAPTRYNSVEMVNPTTKATAFLIVDPAYPKENAMSSYTITNENGEGDWQTYDDAVSELTALGYIERDKLPAEERELVTA